MTTPYRFRGIVLSLLLLCALAYVAIGEEEHNPIAEVIEKFGSLEQPGDNSTIDSHELGKLLEDLVIDAADRKKLESAAELIKEHDGDGNGALNATELADIGWELVDKVLPLTCGSAVRVEAYNRMYSCALTAANTGGGHDAHAHGRRRRLLEVGHDDHGAAVEAPPTHVLFGTKEFKCAEVANLNTFHGDTCDSGGHEEHDGHVDGDEEKEPDLKNDKIGMLFGILALGLVGGLIPILVTQLSTEAKKYLSWAKAFSGGVFLSAGLTHILPEAMDQFMLKKCVTSITGEVVSYKVARTFYPVIPLVVMVGYFLVLMVEKIAFSDHEVAKAADADGNGVVSPRKDIVGQVAATVEGGAAGHYSAPYNYSNVGGETPVMAPASLQPQGMQAAGPSGVEMAYIQNVQPMSPIPPIIPPQGTPTTALAPAIPATPATRGPTDHTPTILAPYLLLAALGVHSIFAGLALGVAAEKAELMSLLIAIASHKSVAALALGSSFVDPMHMVPRNRAIPLIVFFSVLTPIGVGIGIAVSEMKMGVTAPILQALACGTFVYVATSEVVPDEFGHSKHNKNASHFERWVKFFLCLLGAGAIALVGLENHAH